MKAQNNPLHRHLDAALVRATTQTGDIVPRFWPELDDEAEINQWCFWLAQVWAQAPVAEAVTLASPVLAARVEAVCAGQRPRAAQVRRMVLSLARYLVRMRGRATPFGMFAGVAPLRFGPEVSASWTGSHRARLRVDAVWLAGVIARLESCSALRRRLPVIVNDLVSVRGTRLVVPSRPHAHEPGLSGSAEVSVRHSQSVRTVLDTARSPILVGDLTDKLVAEYPDAPASTVDAMLAELVTRGVLISGLRPPSTCTDGLGHVLGQLRDAHADAVAEVAPLLQELHLIHTQPDAAACSTGRIDGHAERTMGGRMSAAVEQPLMVDLRLGCTVVLPAQVAAEAESAAGALLRLTPHPAGHPAWRDYHFRFLDRYGAGAVVTVQQLVDPTAGLGFPTHFERLGSSTLTVELSPRDEHLLALAQQAALDGAHEIVLGDEILDRLAAAEGTDEAQPVTHLELRAEVRAPSMTALVDGTFTLAVTGVSRTAVAMTGRFLDTLPEDDWHRMIRLYGELPVSVDGAVPAQLSFPPKYVHMENVTRVPLVLPDVISLAEHRDGARGRFLVKDLAVTADNDRLYVVSLSRRRIVEPLLTNAAARHTMPSIARLLFEIPRARSAAVSPFAWGAAASLPFLPRVRYGRSVLTPARWRVPSGELPGSAAPSAAWVAALEALRDRLHLPASVHVGTGDRRLRLNLHEPMDLAVLRAHLDGVGDAITVSEALTSSDHGWFGGHAHEIVVPLASTAPPAPAPAVVTLSGPLPLVGREHGALPGSQVLFAKLYGHPDGFDTILMRHLPALLAAWNEPPMWWFVRYRDPLPHLRLRLHLADGRDYGQAAVRVGAWASDLRRRGLTGDLSLDTYRPETARYGSGAVLQAAEAVFAADSAAVLAQLAAVTAAREIHPQALTAASLVDLASAMTGNRSAGMRWLFDHAQTGQFPVRDRNIVRQAITLAGLDTAAAVLPTISGGQQIAAAWQARREAARRYTDRLADDAVHVTPTSVLVSLLHMHHVRAHGIDPDAERLCHRLARSVALAWTARHSSAEGGHR